MDGRNEVPYATTASTTPIATNTMLMRRSSSGVRLESSQTPAAAPASRKPAQGKSVKVPRPGIGRMYHSIGSGKGENHGDDRTTGVIIATSTVVAASHVNRSQR